MAERVGRLAVLFDRDCAFCTWVARQLARIDRGKALELVPLQDAATRDDRPGIAAAAERHHLPDALHVVGPDGSVHREGDALIEIFRRLPGGRLVAAWARLPGARVLAAAIYRLSAENRAALGRLLLASGANCDLPRRGSSGRGAAAPAGSLGPRDTPRTRHARGVGGDS